MNIEFNLELRNLLLELLKNCEPFLKYLHQFKKNIETEYKQFDLSFGNRRKKLTSLSNSYTDKGRKTYSVNLRGLIENSVKELIQYRISDLNGPLNIKELDKMILKFKNTKFPVSLNDFLKVFKNYE